jgi:sulfate/thiosulfate transport system substrate-binding protein
MVRLIAVLLLCAGTAFAETTLLNVSYDVARELYQEYNPLFVKHWQKQTGQPIKVNQSHAGSSKQARAVIDGLQADIVTMNNVNDVDMLADIGRLIPKDWRTRFPNNSSPYRSTMIFLVRKGNPKGIKDWDDLIKPGVGIVIPNPKTAGNGRYSYLAAWAFAAEKYKGDQAKVKEFMGKLFKNVPVLDTGGRGATTTFVQREIGDVLLTFESEVLQTAREGKGKFEAVYPSMSVEAEHPVTVVDKVVNRRGTRKAAEAYLNYLFSDEAQEVIARHNYRPISEAAARKHADKFKSIRLVKIDDVFGGWAKAQKTHFADGGTFDQIYAK